MLPDRKFYVTPNRILDPDIIADAEYIPVGTRLRYDRFVSGSSNPEPDYSTVSELHLTFKDPDRNPRISLSGDEADRAWRNFRLVVGPQIERMTAFREKIDKKTEPES